MALTVGELRAVLTVDASGLDRGLTQAERSMRNTGQRLASTAEDAGQQAGQQLADGITHEMDGLRTDASAAGRRAGTALGDGMQQGARGAGDGIGEDVHRDVGRASGQAGDEAGRSLVGRMRGRVSAGAGEIGTNLREGIASRLGMAALGASAGAALLGAFNSAMEQGRITARLGAQLGASAPLAKQYGQVAGKLYSDAVVDNFQDGADAIKAVVSAGLAPPGTTKAQLESMARKASDVSSSWEEDFGSVTRAVGTMIQTGMAKNADEAFDIITKGFGTSANKGEDLLDTLNEYSVQWKRVGIDGKTAVGLIDQAIDAGARDSDQVADAIGQFGERATAGGAAVEAAFKSIGLNADTIKAKLQKGGKAGREALQMTTDALRNQKDKQVQLNAATALFGDPGTVMGDALFALDPASAAASSGMDKAKGSTDALGNSLRDNASTKMLQFRRGLEQNVVNVLGGQVIPALTGVKTFLTRQFSSIWAEAGKGGAQGADRIVAVFGIIGQRLIEKIPGLATQAVQGLSGFGQKIADYIMANPEQALKIGAIAGAILLGLSLLPVLIAVGLSAAAATIMVSFAAKLVTATTQALPAWWDSVQNWFGEKASEAGSMLSGLGIAVGLWFAGLFSRYVIGPLSQFGTSLILYIAGLPARAVGALAGLGGALAGSARRGFDAFRNAAAQRGVQFVSWVTGLPGRIARGVGSLGGLLSPQGRQVVQGLWNGIAGMGGWLYSQVAGFVSRNVVSAAKNFLHIGSPSRLMADEVGHWIPAGVAAGIEKNSGAVDSAMAGLVTTPTPAATMAATVSAATAGASTAGGSSSSASTVRVDLGGTPFGEFLVGEIRKAVGDRGGNVQLALGR
ncbi:phage tail tape measure protein [Streptomyces griseoaurantiacus]|uniref:phage tail tape measure protein n=1 Tax=Streptomyces griseoaurantiacus TaxID=68213 RepID=UPI00345F3BD5